MKKTGWICLCGLVMMLTGAVWASTNELKVMTFNLRYASASDGDARGRTNNKYSRDHEWRGISRCGIAY